MSKRTQSPADELKVDSLIVLLENQDERMQTLFSKAINLYVAPGADDLDDRVKEDRLKQAVEESFK
jgi:hypothetical protein